MYRLFEGAAHVGKYAKFRPAYPKQIPDTIVNYCQNTCKNFEWALDVGCGSGQGTHQLCNYFKKVTGVDVSQAQITQAQNAFSASHPQMTFLVGSAEDLVFQGADSVDLVTVAQAIHWILDVDRFYREVKRVLRPGGTLAIYGYGNVRLDKQDTSNIFSQLYQEIRGFFEPGRDHIDNRYATFELLPFNDFQRFDDIVMTKTLSLEDFVSYITTLSGYQEYMNINPGSPFLQKYEARFLEAYNRDADTKLTSKDVQVTATWPVFILLSRKPFS